MVCLDDLHPGESKGVCGMLELILSDTVRKDEKMARMRDQYGMVVTRAIEERASEMSRLSEGIYARGLSDGETIGEARGEARGRAKSVASYMSHSGCGLDAALTALGVAEAERPAVVDALRELTEPVTA